MALPERITATQNILAQAAVYAPAALALSLGVEDMVLMDLIAKHHTSHAEKIGAFVLDTGRLHEESYDLLASLPAHYPSIKIQLFFPQTEAVEQYVRFNGINGFYDSISQRKSCCEVRKVDPLRRALAPLKAWITGLRREQSASRQLLQTQEHDETFQLMKFNPLLDWSTEDIWNYVKQYKVPVNALHAQGYPSIGCAPCTRAIESGENIRTGRWWWESAEHKECGLHIKNSSQ